MTIRADVVAILREIQMEIEEVTHYRTHDDLTLVVDMSKVNEIIQEKINALKAESEKINELTEDVETFRKKIMELEKENMDWRNLQEENVKIIGKIERERDKWEQNYHVLEDEVIRLKAKLYDLLDRQGR